MSATNYIQVSQISETSVALSNGRGISYRYAYARSADTRSRNQTGQDYLLLQSSPSAFVFALCDGVSQSFFGDLAARLLGNSLLGWLVEGLPRTIIAGEISEGLTSHLHSLTKQGTKAVQEYQLSDAIPPMLQQVLEQKRGSGSDSTFICGRIDQPGEVFPHGRVVLAWMGDSRLRVWGAGNRERTVELGDTFKTDQRWSSARGPVNGEPHVVVSPLVHNGEYAVSRILTYSDGLSSMDNWQDALANEDLQTLIDNEGKAVTSDDISVLEVWTEPRFRLLPPGRVQPSVETDQSETGGPVTFNFATAFSAHGLNQQLIPVAGSVHEPMQSTMQAHTNPPYMTEVNASQADYDRVQGRQLEPILAGTPSRRPTTLYRASLGMIGLGLVLVVVALAACVLPANGPWHNAVLGPTSTFTPDATPARLALECYQAPATARTRSTATALAFASATTAALATEAATAVILTQQLTTEEAAHTETVTASPSPSSSPTAKEPTGTRTVTRTLIFTPTATTAENTTKSNGPSMSIASPSDPSPTDTPAMPPTAAVQAAAAQQAGVLIVRAVKPIPAQQRIKASTPLDQQPPSTSTNITYAVQARPSPIRLQFVIDFGVRELRASIIEEFFSVPATNTQFNTSACCIPCCGAII